MKLWDAQQNGRAVETCVSESPDTDESSYMGCPVPVNPRQQGQWQAEEGRTRLE